jgi:hypothetical protein
MRWRWGSLIACALVCSSVFAQAPVPDKKSEDLTITVARMARIRRASSPSFSPDATVSARRRIS